METKDFSNIDKLDIHAYIPVESESNNYDESYGVGGLGKPKIKESNLDNTNIARSQKAASKKSHQ